MNPTATLIYCVPFPPLLPRWFIDLSIADAVAVYFRGHGADWVMHSMGDIPADIGVNHPVTQPDIVAILNAGRLAGAEFLDTDRLACQSLRLTDSGNIVHLDGTLVGAGPLADLVRENYPAVDAAVERCTRRGRVTDPLFRPGRRPSPLPEVRA